MSSELERSLERFRGASPGGVQKTTDGGATWVDASGGLTLAGTASIPEVNALAIDPTRPATLSADGWKTMSGGQ